LFGVPGRDLNRVIAVKECLSRDLSFRSFVAARFVRLYPVYLLGTALGFVLELYIHRGAAYAGNSWISWHSILFGVFLVPDFFLSSYVFPIDVPAWSLFGEIVGNIFYAALVRRHAASNRILAFLSLSSLFVLGLWVLRVSGTLDAGARRDSLFLGLARVGYSFFIGVLAYRIYHRNLNRLQIRGVLSWVVSTGTRSSACFELVCTMLSSCTGRFRFCRMSRVFFASGLSQARPER
jgi:peptidoglycan/LPS O-acetylase OafA/YrhL